MTGTPRPDKPWVLIRKGKPPLYFEALPLAQRFYDQLRFNGGGREDAAVFGPGGEAWYCRRFRTARWVRDDDRRPREAAAEAEDAAA